MRKAGIALSLLVAAAACSSDKSSEPSEKPTEPEGKKKRSNVVRVTTAVPPGQHVTCADLLPDPAPFATAMGVEIGEVRDQSKTNSEATAVCSLIRAGEPPKMNMNPEKLADKYAKHGVLPGDEYCMVTAYCSIFAEEEDFKKKCEKDGHTVGSMDGQMACVRATEKGPEYAYTYKFIEPDTKCLIEAMAGPSVNEEALVKNCAIAARDSIAKENLKNAM